MTKNDRANFGSKLGVILLRQVPRLVWVTSGDFPMRQVITAVLRLFSST